MSAFLEDQPSIGAFQLRLRGSKGVFRGKLCRVEKTAYRSLYEAVFSDFEEI